MSSITITLVAHIIPTKASSASNALSRAIDLSSGMDFPGEAAEWDGVISRDCPECPTNVDVASNEI